jgi:hypothetical protein
VPLVLCPVRHGIRPFCVLLLRTRRGTMISGREQGQDTEDGQSSSLEMD